MEEMVYQKERMIKVLHSGVYKGVPFVILNLGTHPTAYVENIVQATDYDDRILTDINVHGGFTFCNKGCWGDGNATKLKWLGWDYAHCYDFMGYYSEDDGVLYTLKRWSTEEILVEVHNVINQLLALNKKRGYYEKIKIT